MASDVIESEVVLKGVGDMSLNNSSPDLDTPATLEELGNRDTPTPSSSGVSGDGEEEALDDMELSTASAVENGEEALQESPTETLENVEEALQVSLAETVGRGEYALQESPTETVGHEEETLQESPTETVGHEEETLQESPTETVGHEEETLQQSPTETVENGEEALQVSLAETVGHGEETLKESPAETVGDGVETLQESPTETVGHEEETLQESPTETVGHEEETLQESPTETVGHGVETLQESPTETVGHEEETLQESPTETVGDGVETLQESPTETVGHGVETLQESPTETVGHEEETLQEKSPTETVENEEETFQESPTETVENGEEALQESLIKTGGPPQERTTPDNGHKQPGARSSTPVSLPKPYSTSGHNGSLERRESVATTEARLRMEGVELKEEWQDEDFPRPLPEEEDMQIDEELFAGTSGQREPVATPVCAVNHAKKTKRKLLAPDISLNLDRSEGSVFSDELDESTELDLDDIDTPSDNSNEYEWEDDLPKPKTTELLQKGVECVQEYSVSEEREEGRRWRVFRFGDQDHRVDMKAIEPYKRVISHGGYYGDGLNAIIVFAVCFMPESSQPNYRYIMDNIFKYVIGTLELLVAENYMIVYLNGATSRKKMPTVGWLRKCYQQIDRRLRKNLKSLIIVHPSWFIRTLLALTRPFISTKFSQKIKYVFSLTDLAELVPMEYVSIPDCIKTFDDEKNRKTRKRTDQDMHGKVEMAAAAVPE